MDELSKAVTASFEEWKKDPVLSSYFSEEGLQIEFLETIQTMIGSKLVIKTKSAYEQDMQKFYDSMIGL